MGAPINVLAAIHRPPIHQWVHRLMCLRRFIGRLNLEIRRLIGGAAFHPTD
jgi:hypothetical protein